MIIRHYPEEKLRREIVGIAGQYLDLTKYNLFFFGSRVSGKGNERSDIDIGIEGHEKIPIEVLTRIKESLANLPTLYSFDVVDFGSASEEFRQVAKQHTQTISPNYD